MLFKVFANYDAGTLIGLSGMALSKVAGGRTFMARRLVSIFGVLNPSNTPWSPRILKPLEQSARFLCITHSQYPGGTSELNISQCRSFHAILKSYPRRVEPKRIAFSLEQQNIARFGIPPTIYKSPHPPELPHWSMLAGPRTCRRCE